MIASMLILNRKGGLHEDDLLKRVQWLYSEIQERKGILSIGVTPSMSIVRQSLTYLEHFIERKKDIFEPSVTAKKDYKNILMLAYYRNNLIHLFLNEAYISCALQAFGESSTKTQGITV